MLAPDITSQVVQPIMTFGNGIKQAILGHRKQILVEQKGMVLLVFRLEQKDTSVQGLKLQDIQMIFGNGTKQLTHGHKRQIWLAQ